MARILYDGEWFEEVSSLGHYESEFEQILQREASQLFRNYHFIRFKKRVASDLDGEVRVPDFALVHNAYRSWWIVEVELGHHSLENHVVPQVRALSRAQYGFSEADYLCRQQPCLCRAKVLELLKGEQPRVLVIVNAPVDNWAAMLRPFRAKVMTCQLFRSRLNKYMIRLNGDYPSEHPERITLCQCDRHLHRMLTIRSPVNLPIERGKKVWLYHNGLAFEWKRVDTGGAVFLVAQRDHDLAAGRLYEIVMGGNGTLAIRRGDDREADQQREGHQ